MANGVNKVILIGNLGADPEMSTTQGGKRLAKIRLATTEAWLDTNGNWQEQTEWHRITAWTHLADKADRYLRKGKQVYIEARLHYDKWQADDGTSRVTTEIVAKQILLLGKKEDEPATRMADKEPPPMAEPLPDTDDDLPF